jgi:hypothetical protein
MQQKSLLYAVAEIVASIETDIESIAETVSACSDSNYNQPATCRKRGTQKERYSTPASLMMSVGSTPLSIYLKFLTRNKPTHFIFEPLK